jgi:integrase
MPATTEYRIGRLNGGFVVTWWEDGKRRRYRLDAQSRAAAEGEAADRIRTERAKSAGSTIAELWELYRTEKKGRRIAEAMQFEWRVMETFFGALRPEQVTIDLCRSYTGARRAMGKRDGTIWTELGHLRTVFLWAAERRLIPYAPSVERPAKPAPKDRWLTLDEIGRLLDVPKPHHIQLAILLMLGTAGRIGAILELEWSRVDFEAGWINLRTTDTGPRKGRAVVPMNDGRRAALSVAKSAALTGHVIEWAGDPVDSIKTGFNNAAIAAGFVGKTAKGNDRATISPHTLRHTAAVHLVSNGVPMQKVSQYLGHSSIAVTERVYGRYAPDHLREEAAILDFTKRAKVV